MWSWPTWTAHTRSPLRAHSSLLSPHPQVLLHKVFPAKGDRRSLDWPAVGRYVVLGAAVFSPVLTYWYRWLDRVLPGTTAKVVMQKVAMDIVVMDVPFYTAFYTVLNMLEGLMHHFSNDFRF